MREKLLECFQHKSVILEKITLEFVYPTKCRGCQGGSGEISQKEIIISQPGWDIPWISVVWGERMVRVWIFYIAWKFIWQGEEDGEFGLGYFKLRVLKGNSRETILLSIGNMELKFTSDLCREAY